MRGLFRSLARFAPLPAALIAVNIAVDPVRVASGDAYERGIADLLLTHRGVTNIFGPKDAAVVRFVIERMRQGPEVIVLGSSRSKLIRSQYFGTQAFFNNSVGGGGITDYLAFYRLYRERRFAPRLVVLEMSPWVLEPTYKSIWEDRYPARADLEREVREGIAPPRSWSPANLQRGLDRVKEIISPGYFQTSVMTWLRQRRLGAPVAESILPYEPGELPLKETMLADGSVVYGESVLHNGERERVRALAIKAAGAHTAIPQALSAERLSLLETFIRQVQRNGAQVVLYLPPYHPEMYDRMVASTTNRLLPQVERAILDVAARTGSETIGSYDPRAIGFTEDDFFDGSHPDGDAIARLFAGRWTRNAQNSASQPRLVGITNANGVETVNGRPFFWIGQGPACINVKASGNGWARISFQAAAGPSIPESPKRRLLVSSSGSAAAGANSSHIIAFTSNAEVSVVVPTVAGVTDACFTALDTPTRARQATGDGRPLLVGASAPRVMAVDGPGPAPAYASAAEAEAAASAGCQIEFGQGWHGLERDGAVWHRWMSGPAELIITANAPATAVLNGSALAITRPDRVDITVNGTPAGGFELVSQEWGFNPFPLVSFQVGRGVTRVSLQSKNPPVTSPNDPRPLTVALQNVSLTLEGVSAPCDVR